MVLAWVLSLAFGLAAGVIAGMVNPPTAPTPAAGGEAEAGLVVLERMPDGSERPLTRGSAAGPTADGDTPEKGDSHALPPAPLIPLYACLPFAALLGAVALMPFIHAKWWHAHYPEVSLALGGFVAGYYLWAMGAFGRVSLMHVGVEYYSFIALVGGLYVASGGLLVDVRARATPLNNTLLLAVGAVLANLIGTTGASVVLIRPFLRMNSPEHGGRLRPLHVVFFIFVVSNCGGCLTPIGDPPLYLGYLKGVPFSWTLTHLWPMWLMVNGALLAVFYVVDAAHARRSGPAARPANEERQGPVRVVGAGALVALTLIVGGVFIDPVLKKVWGIEHVPVGATFQLLVAAAAFVLAPRHVHQANHFSWAPVKEVGMLFAGIFLTMAPALAYLSVNAPRLGLESPTQYYFATGVLSAMLDNAPTYLSFLQIAMSVLGLEVNAADLARFISGSFVIVEPSGARVAFEGKIMLEAISLGAVFFGALTYIGNGPNFMVKAIAEERGVRMPSFFGYTALATMILGPVLMLNWAIFIR